jgi:GxxExxY protein
VKINEVSAEVVDAAMKVHTALGPGLLESAYEACLVYELRSRGLRTEQQVPLPVVYRECQIEAGYRLDVLVEDLVVGELKAAAEMHPIYKAQLLSYLKLSGKPVGLLINFHVVHLRDGIERMINRETYERYVALGDQASSAKRPG